MNINECINLLEISGIDLSEEFVKKAKKKALKKWHPDIAINNGISFHDAHEKTIKIIEAYEYLMINSSSLKNYTSSQKTNNSEFSQKRRPKKSSSKKQKEETHDSEPTERYEKDGKVFFNECHVNWIKYIQNENLLLVKFENKYRSDESIYLYEKNLRKTYNDYVNSHDAGKFQYYHVSYSFKFRRIKSESDWSNYFTK